MLAGDEISEFADCWTFLHLHWSGQGHVASTAADSHEAIPLGLLEDNAEASEFGMTRRRDSIVIYLTFGA